MGFFQFLFSLMFVIPVGLIMIYLLKRLRDDMLEIVKRESQAKEQRDRGKYEYRYESRDRYHEYNNLNKTAFSDRSVSYQSSYLKRVNNFKTTSFGNSTAEIRKRELKEKEQAKKKVSTGALDKRKRRREREKRKRNK